MWRQDRYWVCCGDGIDKRGAELTGLLNQIKLAILESEEVMDDKLYAALNKKKKEISMQVMMYRNTLEQIDADMSTLRKGKSIMSYMEDIGIELVEVPKMYLLSIRKMIQEQDFPDEYGYCFGKLFKKMKEKKDAALHHSLMSEQ